MEKNGKIDMCQAEGTPGGVTGYACLPSRGVLELGLYFFSLDSLSLSLSLYDRN